MLKLHGSEDARVLVPAKDFFEFENENTERIQPMSNESENKSPPEAIALSESLELFGDNAREQRSDESLRVTTLSDATNPYVDVG